MDAKRLRECLAADYGRLLEVAVPDLSAPVPTCPGWVVADLVRHLAEVYLHKAEAMRRQQQPDWPPPGIETVEPVTLLRRAWAELVAEFDQRPAESPTYTWFDPDQTVGFWIRRMAQETAIHRIDAELACSAPVRPVPADLAVDGVDEVLTRFLGYGSMRWPQAFENLAAADRRPVGVSCGGVDWTVRAGADGVEVRPFDRAGSLAALVRGEPPAVLRWLWGRGGEVTVDGDAALVDQLRRLLVTATQ